MTVSECLRIFDEISLILDLMHYDMKLSEPGDLERSAYGSLSRQRGGEGVSNQKRPFLVVSVVPRI